jgi:sugar lactone lactonase YvrE
MQKAELFAEGLLFGEGPRWRDGKLWLSDFRLCKVFNVEMDGHIEPVVEVPNQSSGLGWLPDGRMLIVSMHDRKLLRLEPDGLVEHADLSEIAGGHCNDMVVDTQGRTYVGNFGLDLQAYTGERLLVPQMREDPNRLLNDSSLPTATLAMVDPDGSVSSAASGLRFPNGCAILADGGTLIVAESLDPCLTAFDIAADGTLSNRRVWAQFSKRAPTVMPDGICVDAENAVWVSSPLSNECIRVGEGGKILDRVVANGPIYACMLGGPDRKTLFLIVNQAVNVQSCVIEAVAVDVPGAGLP